MLRFCLCSCAAMAFSPVVRAATVEIPAQAFDAGGWGLDVQFMDVMGSPYLLAHGAGIRVADAKAKVRVPEGGAWRVWVRSRKWTDGAGAFRMRVGGVMLDKVFGVSQSEWDWEDGGEVRLEKGTAEIRLVDGDGPVNTDTVLRLLGTASEEEQSGALRRLDRSRRTLA